MCIKTTGQSASRTTAAISGSMRRADTSLIMNAPASIACAATAALYVSTEMGTGRSPASARMTGMTRAQLLVQRCRVRSRSGGLAAHVDQVRALLDHSPGALDRRRGIEEDARVGERVGSDVDDAHAVRARARGAAPGAWQAYRPPSGSGRPESDSASPSRPNGRVRSSGIRRSNCATVPSSRQSVRASPGSCASPDVATSPPQGEQSPASRSLRRECRRPRPVGRGTGPCPP